jgi:hypothetical protein
VPLLTHIRVTIPMPEGSEPLPWPLKSDLGWPEPDRYVSVEGPGVSGVEVRYKVSRRMVVYRFGLPMRSMLCGRASTHDTGTATQVPMGWYTEGLAACPPWERSIGRRRPFPLRPEWPGFVVNTAVYAGGLLLLVTMPRRMRRWRRAWRTRRGVCPACGYGGISLAGCPECGEGTEGGRGTT